MQSPGGPTADHGFLDVANALGAPTAEAESGRVGMPSDPVVGID